MSIHQYVQEENLFRSAVHNSFYLKELKKANKEIQRLRNILSDMDDKIYILERNINKANNIISRKERTIETMNDLCGRKEQLLREVRALRQERSILKARIQRLRGMH